MTVSGIVVACRPEHLAEMTEAVNAFSWAEVHYTDPKGRLVVTIEADDGETFHIGPPAPAGASGSPPVP